MATLATCIRRAGKALNKSDADAIREIYNELPDSPDRAARAVDEYLDTLRVERSEILDAAAQAGADVDAEMGRVRLMKKRTYTKAERISGLTLIDGDEVLLTTGTGRGGKILAKDIARASDARVRKYNRGKNLAEENARNQETLAEAIALQVDAAMQRTGHAGHWYSDKLNAAIDLAALVHPELETNRNARAAFLAAMAITSNGASVSENTANTEKVYAKYKETGRFPIMGFGKEGPAMKKHFGWLNEMIDSGGIDAVRRFLAAPMTVREIKAAGFSVSGESINTLLNGSAIFGPKIGAGFYQNLIGNYDPLTMDRWWMRTWGRMVGNLAPDGIDSQANKSRANKLRDILNRSPAQLKRLGVTKEEIQDDAVLADVAARVHKEYSQGGYKQKTNLNKAAKNLDVGLNDPVISPRGAKERQYIRDTVALAKDKLRQRGIDVDTATMQALLWYPEKELYLKYGVGDAKSAPTDYAQEFEKLARERRVDPARIDAVLRGAGGRQRSGSRTGGDVAVAGGDPAALATARQVPEQGRAGGGAQLQTGGNEELAGLPTPVLVDGRHVEFGPFAPAIEAAKKYMASKGMAYNPPRVYAKLDKQRSKRIAEQFEAMEHNPADPEVAAAYDAMIEETLEQYQAILDTGLQIEFIQGEDPYGNPRNAILDIINNNRFQVFSTREGFGSDEAFDPSDNPLLRETPYKISGQVALANDIFRVVHDYFGHAKDGVGFRAEGEENAWRSHAAMYSPLAQRAMTTETRGQNSWVNFGPHAQANGVAAPDETVYADQKIGLLPRWVTMEGQLDIEQAEALGGDIRFSKEEQEQVNKDPEALASVLSKLDYTVEEQRANGPSAQETISFWRKLGRKAMDVSNGRRHTLATVPLMYLQDFLPAKYRKAAGVYKSEVDEMDATINELANQFEEKAKPWMELRRTSPETADKLHGVMHHATVHQIDPSLDYKPAFGEQEQADLDRWKAELGRGKVNPNRRAKLSSMIAEHESLKAAEGIRKKKYDLLRSEYDAMGAPAQKIFRDIRDQHRENWNHLHEELDKRIDELEGLDNAGKRRFKAQIRRKFESGRLGVYFPLGRFGDYYAVAKMGDETVAFSKFDSREEANEWVEQMKKQGLTAHAGEESKLAFTDRQGRPEIDDDFFDQVMNKVGKLGPEGKELGDEIWQMYLQRLPALSARKQYIHRKNIRGFTGDALRTYAHTTAHMARSLGRVKHGHKLKDALRGIIRETNLAEQEGDVWAKAVQDEFQLRHERVLNPGVGPLSATLTSIGAHWFLGVVNPSAAAVNLTQNWLLGLPALSAYHAEGKDTKLNASAELLKASKQMMRWDGRHTSKLLTQQEMSAFIELERRGVLDKTRAMDLIGLSERGGEYSVSRMASLEKASMSLFQAAESHNRNTMALAAYRLAKDRGMTHDDAVQHAADMVWEVHFDYSQKNRPRLMQNDFGRVAFLFRNYSVNIAYRMLRDFHTTFKGKDPKVKRIAAKRLRRLMMSTFLMAGARGLPIWGAITLFAAAFSDDDEPVNPKQDIYEWLHETQGQRVADFVMYGAIDSITQASISGRIGLSNLFIQDPIVPLKNWQEELGYYGGQLLGPYGSQIETFARGGDTIGEGQTARGLESFMPKTARDIAQALRFGEEGITTLGGRTVMDADDLDEWELAIRAAGFQPMGVMKAYQKGSMIKWRMAKHEVRQDRLRSRYIAAMRNEDEAEALAVLEEVDTYADKNPELRWGRRNVLSAWRRWQRDERNYFKGIRLPRRQRNYWEDQYLWDEEEEQ